MRWCKLRQPIETVLGAYPKQSITNSPNRKLIHAPSVRCLLRSGLGLGVSKRVVKLLGGDLDFQSAVGIGTSFTFTVPAPIAPPPLSPNGALVGTVDTMSPGLGRNLRILVADDQKMMLNLFRSYFQGFEVDLTEANNGQQVVALWQKAIRDGTPFDCVITVRLIQCSYQSFSLRRCKLGLQHANHGRSCSV